MSTVHDPVVVHRVRHAPVPDRAGHRRPAVSPAAARQRGARARAGRVRDNHVRGHVRRPAGRVPAGAHQDTAQPDRGQDVPQPVHTHAHPGHAVLHGHGHRPGAAQDEGRRPQDQQGRCNVVWRTRGRVVTNVPCVSSP